MTDSLGHTTPKSAELNFSSVVEFVAASALYLKWVNWSDEDAIELFGSRNQFFSGFLSEFAAPSHGKGILKFLSKTSDPNIFDWNSQKG